MFSWRINSLAFSGGEIVTLEPGSVCLLIGPNSSGKSAALRNLHAHLTGATGPHAVIQQATVVRSGTRDDFRVWFEENYPTRRFQGGQEVFTTRPGAAIPTSSLEDYWAQSELMPGLWQFLSLSLDTASRTTIANYGPAIDVWNAPPTLFVHSLQTNAELEAKVSNEMQAAFGRQLVIDWSATPQVGFRVGQAPERTLEHDRVSEAYSAALQLLPRLDEDGDGIRSFAGCLLAMYCGSQPVLMIDEPEAFLHPPQARRLGAALARAAKENNRQVILATHSADIVQGALNTGAKVAVCRMVREGDRNHAAQLPSAELSALWSKPLLRSAAAIDGLFHQGVVVCEADGDVRFYEAILQRAEDKGLIAAPDFFFTQGSGKGELPTLAGSYRKLATKAAIIADIDLLRNPVEHQKCLAALGSELDTDDRRYKVMMNALGDAAPLMSINDALAEVETVVAQIRSNDAVSGADRQAISRALQRSSTFSEAKRYGVGKLRGEPLTVANELLSEWRAVGLFLLPVGELEGWWREGPASDKNAWLSQAIVHMQEADSFQEAEQFVCEVARFLGAV